MPLHAVLPGGARHDIAAGGSLLATPGSPRRTRGLQQRVGWAACGDERHGQLALVDSVGGGDDGRVAMTDGMGVQRQGHGAAHGV